MLTSIDINSESDVTPYIKIYCFNYTLSDKRMLLINIVYLFSKVYNKNPFISHKMT